MRNSIASVSEHNMIQLVRSLITVISSPRIASDHEPLPMVILTILPSAEISAPPGLALVKILAQHTR